MPFVATNTLASLPSRMRRLGREWCNVSQKLSHFMNHLRCLLNRQILQPLTLEIWFIGSREGMRLLHLTTVSDDSYDWASFKNTTLGQEFFNPECILVLPG